MQLEAAMHMLAAASSGIQVSGMRVWPPLSGKLYSDYRQAFLPHIPALWYMYLCL